MCLYTGFRRGNFLQSGQVGPEEVSAVMVLLFRFFGIDMGTPYTS